jgi:S-adenosylmethionine:tRNA ribosyltransferase-isomerase
MTAATLNRAPLPNALDFVLPHELEATQPPEISGHGRDDVRLLVSVGTEPPVDTWFYELPEVLDPRDLLVVNTSATMAAALDATDDAGHAIEVHLSTELPSGLWLVELRRPAAVASQPDFSDHTGARLDLGDGITLVVLTRYRDSRRLWLATIDVRREALVELLARRGRPIRYRHVPSDWPLEAYQSVFSVDPGSAEMPSASRPFTADLVTTLVTRGVQLAPLTLHTGVSSQEGGERPYPEWFRVPAETAARVNATRAAGGRVVAIGTTVVRALESAVDEDGRVVERSGWTDVVITPERGVRVVDGLLTGWHEPEASHLLMLEAIAGRPALELAYGAAVELGYRWHEFGDTHLILPRRDDDLVERT